MDHLKSAVSAGIISETQRRAIEALARQAPVGFKFSLVHLLWLGGASLIIFALILLAAEISQGDAWRLTWVCLAYTGGLGALDYVIRGRPDLRLLSSVLLLAMAITGAFAVGSFVKTRWGLIEPGMPWSHFEHWYEPLLLGYYLPGAIILGVSILLLRRRQFLPAWAGVTGFVAYVVIDLFYGLRLDLDLHGSTPWLALAIAGLALGWWYDLRPGANHGFWLNKAGLLAFNTYAFVVGVEAIFGTVAYWHLLPTGAAVALFSVYLRRPAGISVGALALVFYFAHWFDAWDDLYTAVAILAVAGVTTIFVGVKAHLIEDQLDRLLPLGLRRLRPEARRDPVTFGF